MNTEPSAMRLLTRWPLLLLAAAGALAQEPRPAGEQVLPTPGKVWRVPSLGVEFVPIPAGRFVMGTDNVQDWEKDQAPAHEVTLTKPFWMGECEVTIREFLLFLNETGDASGVNLTERECPIRKTATNYELSGSRFGQSEKQPMTHVSWYGAQAFRRWLTERERKAGRLPADLEYRLPTEAEWEYCCRAGTTGDDAGDPDQTAWYKANSGDRTHEVGGKIPNAWGLYDILGNVSEWCMDWYAPYAAKPVTDPSAKPDPIFKVRVARGACFSNTRYGCRVPTRLPVRPSEAGWLGGFRIVLGPVCAESPPADGH